MKREDVSPPSLPLVHMPASIPSVRSDAFDGEGLTVHFDRAAERNGLDDQALGKTAVLGIGDEVGQLFRRGVRLQSEVGIHPIPSVVYRPLEDGTPKKLPEANLHLRILDSDFHHVRVPRHLGE